MCSQLILSFVPIEYKMKDLGVLVIFSMWFVYSKRHWIRCAIRDINACMWLLTSNTYWIRNMLKEVDTIEAYRIVIYTMFKDRCVNEGRLFVLYKFTSALDNYHNTDAFSKYLKKTIQNT